MKRALLVVPLLLAAGFVAPHTTSGAPPAAQPAPTPRPAPTEDRIGFPEGYQTSYQTFFVFDRPDNKQVRVVYANDQAAAARSGEPFPYGSILVMETYRAVLDADGNPELDADRRYQRGELTGLFVMRKEPGFGAAYEALRTGEWEYVAYRPDRTHLTPPRNTASCAACHTDAGGTRDWVFRPTLFFNQASGALPTPPAGLAEAGRVPIQSYLFLPDTIVVAPGTTVTWSNEDEAVHTVTANDGNFDSGRLALGALFTHTFDQPGTYEYTCTIHPASMQARVVVE